MSRKVRAFARRMLSAEIVEVKRQEVLLKTGALQSAILNSANFSSIATDEAGVIQIFNTGAEQMLGYAEVDVLNKITPADISDPQEVIARAKALSQEFGEVITPGFEALVFKASRGIEDIYELTYLCKDGSRLPAIVSVTTLRDVQRKVIGYLLIGTDNTARKQVEAAQEALDQRLRDQQFYTRSLIESNIDALMTTDPAGIITDVNKQMEELTGCTRDELIGAPFKSYFTDPARAEAGIKQVLREKKVTNYELTARARDGKETVVSYNATTFYDRERTLQGVFAAARDVTERNRAEDKFRALVESAPYALVIAEQGGDIVLVNSQAEQVFGYRRSEMLGKKIEFLIPERFHGGHPTHRGEYFMEPKIRPMGSGLALYARRKDGSEFPVEISLSSLDTEGGRLITASILDITERKRLDQVLHDKNAELESARSLAEKANLSKSEFLSSMSHELRSPLNAILGFAQLMDMDLPAASASQKSSIDQILRAGWHLLALINEILDLAKIESGQVPMSKEPISLSEVMIECQGMIEPQAQKRRISMNFPRFEVPCFVQADRTRMKQILLNLLSNAIKYNKPEGSVVVGYVMSTPGRIRISVGDTGEGLTPNHLTQLFQPFNRLGQESGLEEGTGIGLVVAKRLAELMGGVIGVESTVGVGSIFWFELPAVAEPLLVVELGEALAAVPPARLSKQLHTILYVEDNPANLKLVERIIARQPELRLLTAITAPSGIELARLAQPDVILMDINLPGMSGLEALKLLQSDPLTAHIPVLAISANAMLGDIKRGLDAGFHRYLTKPIKVAEFTEALGGALKFAETKSTQGKEGPRSP